MGDQIQYTDPRTAAFRKTLDRIPDEIALAIGLRLYDEDALLDGHTCVCGWAVREVIARETGQSADAVEFLDFAGVCDELELRFDGAWCDWEDIFVGVCTDDAPLIEEALFDRVMAAVENATRRPTPRKAAGKRGAKR